MNVGLGTGFDAVIFDLDGTLIDTERHYVDSAHAALHGLGHAVRRDFLLTLVGRSDAEGNRMLGDHIGPDFDETAFNTAWSAEIARAIGVRIPAMPGADTLLSHLSASARPFALATNSATEAAHRKLKRAGLTRWFRHDHVFGHDRVTMPKPAPDLYLAAAAAVGADPARCLAFEDSHAGIEAALSAGMTVVQVPGLLPNRHPDAHIQADGLIDGARAVGLI